MTPEQHAKAIEDAAVDYANACVLFSAAIVGREKPLTICVEARSALISAIRAGVGAPEGWQLVPVELSKGENNEA